MNKINVTSGYDWKKTAMKVLKSGIVVFLAGLIATFQNDPKWLAIIPVVEGVQNMIKHWNA